MGLFVDFKSYKEQCLNSISRVKRFCFTHVNAKVDYAGVLPRNQSYQHLSGTEQDQEFLKNLELCQTGSDRARHSDINLLFMFCCITCIWILGCKVYYQSIKLFQLSYAAVLARSWELFIFVHAKAAKVIKNLARVVYNSGAGVVWLCM